VDHFGQDLSSEKRVARDGRDNSRSIQSEPTLARLPPTEIWDLTSVRVSRRLVRPVTTGVVPAVTGGCEETSSVVSLTGGKPRVSNFICAFPSNDH